MLTTTEMATVVTPGDATADDDCRIEFDAFYRATRDDVATALALTFRSRELGAEAADEAMARALQRWEHVQTMTNPAGWVYRVGLNWGRSLLRRSRRETFDLSGSPSGTSTVDAGTGFDPDLDAALATLDLKHRAVVVLRHLLEYSERETAAALGISEGTVKSRLSRALTKLRNALDER